MTLKEAVTKYGEAGVVKIVEDYAKRKAAGTARRTERAAELAEFKAWKAKQGK